MRRQRVKKGPFLRLGMRGGCIRCARGAADSLHQQNGEEFHQLHKWKHGAACLSQRGINKS